MNLASLIFGIVGVVLALYFGIRSLLQSQNLEGLQEALRAYNQGLFNNVWRVGGNAEQALKADQPTAQQFTRGIADMSQTIRHMIVAFSNRHTGFTPYQENAWEPRPLPPELPRSWWHKFFQL